MPLPGGYICHGMCGASCGLPLNLFPMKNPVLTPWRVVIAGMLALAAAMGIGRFAFTPLLPMMLQGRLIDLPGASWLASANYFGYLAGALACTMQPWIWRRLARREPGSGSSFTSPPELRPTALVRVGLIATCFFTLAMSLEIPAAWPALRFAAGVASALVFVYTSGWCLGQLARLGVPSMGAMIYMGPGMGIVVSGMAASGMLARHWPAWAGWLAFGLLAALLTAFAWPAFDARHGSIATGAAMPPALQTTPPATPFHGRAELSTLAFAYGLAGFGYIITATFLPVIARGALPGSPWLDLFWPLLGGGVIAGAWLASRPIFSGDMRVLLAGCYGLQALGIVVGMVAPSLVGFALGSLLVGLPFTAITYFAMQEGRRLRPLSAPAFMGLLTALYGLGQIVGPPMTAALLARSRSTHDGFQLALGIAAGALLVGAAIFIVMVRVWPLRRLPPVAG